MSCECDGQWVRVDGEIKRCECFWEDARKYQINKLIKACGRDLNVKLEQRPNQSALIKPFQSGESLWIHGESRGGKTYLAGRNIMRYIESSKRFDWIWIRIDDLMEMLSGLYGDEARENKAMFRKLKECKVLGIDDFDKVGNMTH